MRQMPHSIDREFIARLRKHFELDDDVPDEWVIEHAAETFAGAIIRVNIAFRKLWEAIKEEMK